jgi:tripartite-type tricarboxylate transporter receptor subunit TctC
VAETCPGGGAVIGSVAVARARPGEGLLGVVVSTHTINTALRDDLPYGTLRDFTDLMQLARAPIVIVAGAGFPAAILADAPASARGRDMPVVTPGIGTVMPLTLDP